MDKTIGELELGLVVTDNRTIANATNVDVPSFITDATNVDASSSTNSRPVTYATNVKEHNTDVAIPSVAVEEVIPETAQEKNNRLQRNLVCNAYLTLY